MNITKYTATVTKVTQLNSSVKLFRLSFTKSFHFQAGQFIILDVTDVEGRHQRRSYSIASSPEHTDYIELCIKIIPDGRVSGVLDTITEGSIVELDGPYGKFTIDKKQKKELIMVAAGVGVAPFRSLLLDLYHAGYDAPVSLFFGFRFIEDYIFKDEFEQLKRLYKKFSFFPVISRPDGSHEGFDVGHINTVLSKYIKCSDNKMVYICGSLPMVKDVVVAFEEINFTRDQIKTDAWG